MSDISVGSATYIQGVGTLSCSSSRKNSAYSLQVMPCTIHFISKLLYHIYWINNISFWSELNMSGIQTYDLDLKLKFVHSMNTPPDHWKSNP